MRKVDYTHSAPEQVWESGYYQILIQNALPSIHYSASTFHTCHLLPSPILARSSFATTMCTPSIATFIGKVLGHRETLLTFTCITWNVILLVSEDDCHLLFTCSAYSAIRSRYDDILRGSDNLRAIPKTPSRRLGSYVYALFMHRDTYQEHIYTPIP